MEASNYDQDDLNNAILCDWKEARGDGHAAMNAVAHVIFNRGGAAGFAKTLHQAIYGKFSSMSICTDPEYNLGAPSVTDREYASYVAATNIVEAVAERTDSDPTNGARYCANLKESTSGWFVRHIVNDPVTHPKRAIVGHQVFTRKRIGAWWHILRRNRCSVLLLISSRMSIHECNHRECSPGSYHRAS